MKTYFVLLILIPLLTTGCERKKFEVDATLGLEKIYEVNNYGDFNEYAEVTDADISDLLNIPEDAVIEEVNIESISMKMSILSYNEASDVYVRGYLQMGSDYADFIDPWRIPITEEDRTYLLGAQLINGGVEILKRKLEDLLSGIDAEPFYIHLIGSTYPSGSSLHIKITLTITGNVAYFQCVEVPFFIEGDEPC